MSVKQYTKKPVTIEAIQYTGRNNKECLNFCTTAIDPQEIDGALAIPTLKGTMICNVKDFIIKGIEGEFYPCKPDIFWGSYVEQIKD